MDILKRLPGECGTPVCMPGTWKMLKKGFVENLSIVCSLGALEWCTNVAVYFLVLRSNKKCVSSRPPVPKFWLTTLKFLEHADRFFVSVLKTLLPANTFMQHQLFITCFGEIATKSQQKSSRGKPSRELEEMKTSVGRL